MINGSVPGYVAAVLLNFVIKLSFVFFKGGKQFTLFCLSLRADRIRECLIQYQLNGTDKKLMVWAGLEPQDIPLPDLERDTQSNRALRSLKLIFNIVFLELFYERRSPREASQTSVVYVRDEGERRSVLCVVQEHTALCGDGENYAVRQVKQRRALQRTQREADRTAAYGDGVLW